MYIIAILITWLVTFVLTRRFCDPRSRLHILDHPNERSLHTNPVPRSGGVALMAGMLSGAILIYVNDPQAMDSIILFFTALPICVVSFIDDRYQLNPTIRLLTHVLVATILITTSYRLDRIQLPGLVWEIPVWIAIPLTLLFIVWMINLYNFMDGMDGFAGGMAFIGFACFAVMGWHAHNFLFSNASLLITAASAGFLWFNFPPARIFMGDTGSSALGFLVAGFTLWGSQVNIFPVWVAMLVFSPFIVDATVTLVRRLFQGEKIWLPHKTHYYQKLVQIGWEQKKTVLAEYTLMLACSVSALLTLNAPPRPQVGLLLTWLLLYAGLMMGVNRLVKKYTLGLFE